ncbi:HupE/UreJ family protein [Chondrinema litorale]|uniref:HupE/UreJ family protein n=1 Tax=Chondrinema litorale TaxID=2994555 RepID=UPI002543C8F0|nr:HupE/UreJ family protein [Chondrinema litorale]UZR96874.1 HupE/UreJ family protein [Chondrinema litorale]UZR98536.1 HupE/UreJ family protein [Chondrinema litorale]
MNKHKILVLKMLIMFALITFQKQALGHPMPNTVIELSVGDQTISGTAKMPFIVLMDATMHNEAQIDSSFILAYFSQHILASTANNNWQTVIKDYKKVDEYDREVGNYSELEIHFELIPPTSEEMRQFSFVYNAIIHQVITHKVLVFLKYDWNSGLISDKTARPIGVIETDYNTNSINPLKIDLEQGSWFKGTWAMFLYGMEHIRVGLDHILFLLTLLLVAPLTVQDKNWTGFQGLSFTLIRFLKISFAFTIGHSITLLAGSFDLIPFRAQYIEVLIAVSILISAIHCIKPIFNKREPLVAASFGLIHGLAFSISLSSMNLDWQARLLSVLGFNLGIESMQLIIMVCFFPLLLASKWKYYSVIRMSFAVITGITAIAWIFERMQEKENVITAFANSLL